MVGSYYNKLASSSYALHLASSVKYLEEDKWHLSLTVSIVKNVTFWPRTKTTIRSEDNCGHTSCSFIPEIVKIIQVCQSPAEPGLRGGKWSRWCHAAWSCALVSGVIWSPLPDHCMITSTTASVLKYENIFSWFWWVAVVSPHRYKSYVKKIQDRYNQNDISITSAGICSMQADLYYLK